MEREDRQRRQPGDQGVGVQEVEEATDVDFVGIDRHAAQHVAESHSPQQRRHQAAAEERPVPGGAPGGVLVLAAELEGHAAGDECQEHQHQGQVEAAEKRRVPFLKDRSSRAAGRERP